MQMIKLSLPSKFLMGIHDMDAKEQEEKFGVSEIGFCSTSDGAEMYSTIMLSLTKGDEDIPCDPLDTDSVYQPLEKWKPIISAIVNYTGAPTTNYVVYAGFVAFVHLSNDICLPETFFDCTIIIQKECDEETRNLCAPAIGMQSTVGVPYRCRLDKLALDVFGTFRTVKEVVEKMKKLGVYVYPDKYI